MNKKLLAIAIAAGLATPMAANAAISVFGTVNTGVANYDNGTDGELHVMDDNSRFGLKGSEDLGGGLSVYFKYDTVVAFDQTQAGTGAFGRDKYLGFKGGFGSVQMGHYNTGYKNSTGKLDLFADAIGDITGDSMGRFDSREADQVSYISNNINGFKLVVDLSFSETADAVGTTTVDEAAMGTSVAASYQTGGLYFSVATATKSGTSTVGGAAPEDSATKVGVQWKGGPHTVNFVTESIDANLAATKDVDAMALQYGMKMGKNTFAVSYKTTDWGTSTNESTELALAVFHQMSKSTKVYVAYATVDNDALATDTGRLDNIMSGTGLAAPAAGKDPSALGVGIQHNF